MWGIVALVVQLGGFFVTRLVLPSLPERSKRATIAAAIFLAGLSLALGILNAACMTG